MKIFIYGIPLLFIFPLISAGLMFEKRSGGMEIGINPNSELMYTILQLSKSSGELRTVPPKPDVTAIFAAYGNHPAVAELDPGGALNWKKGLCYDAFAVYPLYFSAMPEGKRIQDYDAVFLSRVLRGMSVKKRIKYLDAYWEKVRDFYLKTDFQNYLRQNAAAYESYVASACAGLPAYDVIKEHGEYSAPLGYKFHMVPLPLGLPTGGSYGPRVGNDVYNLMGRTVTADNVKYLLLHEFGHNFTNPVVEKHAALAEKHRNLFSGIEKEMTAMAYGEWLTVMRELLVRAVHARIVLKKEGPEAAAKLLKDDSEAKFVFIYDFYNLLSEYEGDRAKYPTLYEFYPRLAAELGNWELREVKETEKPGFNVQPWQYGPYITRVAPGGSGYAAGFREKDVVIGIDGEQPDADFLNSFKGGRTASVTVLHAGGKTETFTFTLKSIDVVRPVRKTLSHELGAAGRVPVF